MTARQVESKDKKTWNPVIIEGSESLMGSRGSLHQNSTLQGKARFERGSIQSIDLKNKLKNSRFLGSRENSNFISHARSSTIDDGNHG